MKLILQCAKTFILLFICHSTLAVSDEELKTKFMQIVLECMKKKPLTPDDLTSLQHHIIPETCNAKCVLACAYKSVGAIDNKGLFSEEGGMNVANRLFPGDNEKLKKSKEFIDICKSINNEPVSDGANGCDRAGLLFKCVRTKGTKLGFKI